MGDGKLTAYKFERLEIYQAALEYLDLIYALADHLPKSEEYNLRSQVIRAATSIVLNIAEGSTSQSILARRSIGGLRSNGGSIRLARFIGRDWVAH